MGSEVAIFLTLVPQTFTIYYGGVFLGVITTIIHRYIVQLKVLKLNEKIATKRWYLTFHTMSQVKSFRCSL